MKNKPNVLIFAEYFPPYLGAERRIFELARNMRGWTPTFCVIPPLRILAGHSESALEEYYRLFQHSHSVEREVDGMRGVYLRIPSALRRLWALSMPVAYVLSIAHFLVQAVSHIKRARPQIIVAAHPTFLCGLVALLAARVTGTRFVLDYPDAYTPLAIETAGLRPNGLQARLLRMIESFIARASTRCISITQALAPYIREMGYTGEIAVVGNGGNGRIFDRARVRRADARAQYGLDPTRPIIVYAGRVEAWAGVEALPAMMELVHASVPDAQFIFAGDGLELRNLEAEMKRRGLEQIIRLFGIRPYEEMPAFIATADVAIVPFPDTPVTRPCSPVKLFEYMLMGVPVIASDLPGIRESVEGTVPLVPNEPAPLANAIIRLLSSRSEAAEIAEHGYALAVKSHTWEKLADQYERHLFALA